MSGITFTNIHIFDGSGSPPFPAELRVEGNRITHVSRDDTQSPAQPGDRIIDGQGGTLMPGLVEAHAHLSWPTSVERFVPGMWLPLEDLVLNTARNARILLDYGFTSAYSAGSLSKLIEVALHKQIETGGMPGPRFIPSSIERSPPSPDELAPGQVEDHGQGPDAIRAFIKDCAKMGAKSVKFLLSGQDTLIPGTSQQLLYTEEEARAAGEQARESGIWLCAHAQAAEAVKMAIRNGFRVIYHCSYADEEALDMLEANRDKVFMAPAIGIVQAIIDVEPRPGEDMTSMKHYSRIAMERQRKLVPELKRRGVRVLPGGDYGFPFNPNGTNAKDLELFVLLFGYTPAEALRAATQFGGEIMGLGNELGLLKPGYLADLLLVDGDPSQDITLLQDKSRLKAIMKDGRFHKDPADPRHRDATRRHTTLAA